MIVPRTMSTQHPDNVTTPFFATGALLTPDDEVREAYYAFSHLGCDEQMWDFEGKEVDEHVVEKLLTTYDDYFATRRLGEDVFLTPPAIGEAPTPETTGDPRFCSRWSLVGAPAITIPTGLGPHRLPLGLQLVGAPGDDERLLSAAAWAEAMLPSIGAPPL